MGKRKKLSSKSPKNLKKAAVNNNQKQSEKKEQEDPQPIIGTSQNVEKPYFRLTSAPKPSDVRPLPVLRTSLQNVKREWLADSNKYKYCCDQLKSIRQDLTIQHIQDEFVVGVYELHGRLALENNDFSEFLQCLSMLLGLYEKLGYTIGHIYEFVAYKILYSCFLNVSQYTQQKKKTKERITATKKFRR